MVAPALMMSLMKFVIIAAALPLKLSATANEEKALLLSTTANYHRQLSTKKGKKTKKDAKKNKKGKDAKKSKKESKSGIKDYNLLCNKRLFEGMFEYQNGCAKTTIASILLDDDDSDTCYYTEALLDGKSSCPLYKEDDTEDDNDDKCSIGELNRFVGGAFQAKTSISYNRDTGDCELSYTDLSIDPCCIYPNSLGVKASINLLNHIEAIPSFVGNSSDVMIMYFTDNFGASYYNENSPRIAVRVEATDDIVELGTPFLDVINKDDKDSNNTCRKESGGRRRSLKQDECTGCDTGSSLYWYDENYEECYQNVAPTFKPAGKASYTSAKVCCDREAGGYSNLPISFCYDMSGVDIG